MSHPGAAQPATALGDLLASARAQAAAACARSAELQQRTTLVLTQAQAARQTSAQARRRRRSSPAGQDLLQRSEHARLLARLESLPVIEQAKGIIMAQSRCGDTQAFDLLRRASQRGNVPVRELAAQIVAKTAQAPPPPIPRQAVSRQARHGQAKPARGTGRAPAAPATSRRSSEPRPEPGTTRQSGATDRMEPRLAGKGRSLEV